MLTGANCRCINLLPFRSVAALYQLLYLLTGMTGDPRYAAAADAALRFFLASCLVPESGLLAWGEHAQWDFREDTWAKGAPAVPFRGVKERRIIAIVRDQPVKGPADPASVVQSIILPVESCNGTELRSLPEDSCMMGAFQAEQLLGNAVAIATWLVTCCRAGIIRRHRLLPDGLPAARAGDGA